jgi:hypothetical protein
MTIDPFKKQMEVIADLQNKLALKERENASLKKEKEALEAEVKLLTGGHPVRRKKHIKVRVRKDGTLWRQWGSVADVVAKSQHLTCRQIVDLTGFDRYAVYSAARRMKIKLKSPYQRPENTPSQS